MGFISCAASIQKTVARIAKDLDDNLFKQHAGHAEKEAYQTLLLPILHADTPAMQSLLDSLIHYVTETEHNVTFSDTYETSIDKHSQVYARYPLANRPGVRNIFIDPEIHKGDYHLRVYILASQPASGVNTKLLPKLTRLVQSAHSLSSLYLCDTRFEVCCCLPCG